MGETELPFQFCIQPAESTVFAQLSGDFNPLHCDPVHARRLKFGGAVIHGLHICFILLDKTLEQALVPPGLASLKADFFEPVFPNRPLRATSPALQGNAISWTISWKVMDQSQKLATIRFTFTTPPPSFPLAETPEPSPCLELTPTMMATTSGKEPLTLDQELLKNHFPHAARCPPGQLANLLATTRIVGMRCPGRHSIFAGLDVQFTPPATLPPPSPTLSYRTTDLDTRFSRVMIRVEGPGMAGQLETFIRPPPVRQTPYPQIQSLVTPGCFGNWRALIVGGSRGLGEVVAKLVAAGGGESRITYNNGCADAAALCEEIHAGGGRCTAHPWNILDSNQIPEASPFFPDATHLFYFATPPIIPNTSGQWNAPLFENFSRYYVTAFAHTLGRVRAGRKKGIPPLKIFYPSTFFLDAPEPGMAEYTAAKAAGEALCRCLNHSQSDILCICPRLEKMLTDQTGGLQFNSEATFPDTSEQLLKKLLAIQP